MCSIIMCHFAKDKLHVFVKVIVNCRGTKVSVCVCVCVAHETWKMQQDVAFTVLRLAILLSWQFV